MQTLLGISGLLSAGVLTPGPNNLVVMREAARAGWNGALPAILGVLSGSLALLAVVAAGAGAAFDAAPWLAGSLTIGGCLYLGWIGVRLFGGTLAGRATEARAQPHLPSGTAGLFAFQFLNPKAWALTVTVVATARSSVETVALPSLAVLLVLISAAGLALWSSLGLWLIRLRTRPRSRVRFDRLMGGLLVGSALLLLVRS